MAAEKVENVINQSLLIGQSFVHGDSFQTYLVAVVVPDEEPTRAHRAEQHQTLCRELLAAVWPRILRTLTSDFPGRCDSGGP